MKFAASSTAIWNSTDSDSKGPVNVKVVGPTDPSEYDHDEVGQMYDIELKDGSSETAFEDEPSAQS